jgi:hypothetical protein
LVKGDMDMPSAPRISKPSETPVNTHGGPEQARSLAEVALTGPPSAS